MIVFAVVFVAALSLLLLVSCVLKGCFPLAVKEGTRRGRPLRTPEGATKWSTRRESKSCADGLVVYDEAERGMLQSASCFLNRRQQT